MNSSRTKLVLMALLGSVAVAVILLLVLDPGSPPVGSQPEATGDARPVEGLEADPMTGETAVDETAVGERQALVPPEDATPGITISGRVQSDPRVSIAGGVVLAYVGKPDDKKGAALSNIWGNLARSGSGSSSSERPEIVMRLTGEPLAQAEVQADGSFMLEGIRERHVRLDLKHDFYGLKGPEPVHVPEGEDEVTTDAVETYMGAHVIGQLVGPGREEASAVINIAAEPDPMSVLHDLEGFMSRIMQTGELETRSDEEGRFEFRAIWPSSQVRLMLRSEEYTGRTEVFSLAAGETRELLLGTQPAITVHALVENQEGEPVQNAQVSTTPLEIMGDTSRGIARSNKRTDDEGTATITGLSSGLHRIAVEASGYRAIDKEVELDRGGEPQVIGFILDQGGSVSGVVVDPEGLPVSEASVAHIPTMDIPVVGDLTNVVGDGVYAMAARGSSFRTDVEGRFKVTGLQDPNTFRLIAVAEDYLPGSAVDVRMGDEDVTIQLQRGGSIVGTVVEAESDDPIHDFTVESLVSMMMVMERPDQIETVRDAPDGRFELRGVGAGTIKLRFRAEGRADAIKRVPVEAGEEIDVGIVTLDQHAVIRGQVQGADGRPVAGAMVRRKTGGMTDNPILTAFTGQSSVRSDEEGRFELGGMTPGRLILLAQADGHASGQSGRLRVEAGQMLDDVVIQLGSGGSIAGRVLLPPGESMDDWQVIPSQIPNGTAYGGSLEADGSFRFDNLDPGRYEVQAFNLQKMMGMGNVNVTDFRSGQGFDMGNLFDQINDSIVRVRCMVEGGETTEIELDATELGAPGITLEVTVRLGNNPMAGGWAEIKELDGSNTLTGVVDQGAMRLTGLTPGELSIQVRSGISYAPVGEPTILEIPEGVQTHRVNLDLPGGEIRGRVMDDSTGDALSGTMVRLIHEGRNVEDENMFGFALTDEEGQFVFLGLGEGTYGLVAGGQYAVTEVGRMNTSRLQGIEVRGSEIVEGLVLRAQPGAGVTVLVTDEMGAPLAGALLLAVDEEGSPLANLGLTFTGPDGRGEFGGLPAGPLRIVGRRAGLAPAATRTRDVIAGDHVDLTLRLGKGPRVTLRITDAQGQTLNGAVLSARTQDSPWFPATLLVQDRGPDGTLGIGPVPAGTWEFRVFHPETGMFQVTRDIPRAERASLILSPK